MAQLFLVQLSVVHYQPFGCRPRFSHQESGAAVFGVVPVLVLQDQASVDTFLYLLLNLVGLLFRSWIGSSRDLVTHELGVQLEVHLYQLVK